MPFKSKAQRRKFAEHLVNGKITPEVFEEWNRETGSAKLPERVKPKGKKPARRARRKATAKGKTTAKRKTAGRKAARRGTPARRKTSVKRATSMRRRPRAKG